MNALKELTQYECFGAIANGSVSTIYEGYDHQLKREIVIKELRSEFRQHLDVVDAFWAEATLMAGMNHAHILRVYDIDRSRHWIIMEPMLGTLQAEVRASQVSPSRLRELLKQLLEGVRHLHQLGRVHGQLRIDTILLDQYGQAKLTNLSIADMNDEFRRPDHKQLHTAPEILNPKHFGQPGLASDLYCLGLVAVQLVGGDKYVKLFKGMERKRASDPLAWSAWHASLEPVAPIRTIRSDLPDDLAQVIDGLTQKQVGLRFASAADALSILNALGPSSPACPADSSPPACGDDATVAASPVTYNSPNLFAPLSGHSQRPEPSAWDRFSQLRTGWKSQLQNRQLKLVAMCGLMLLVVLSMGLLGETSHKSSAQCRSARKVVNASEPTLPPAEKVVNAPAAPATGYRKLWVVARDNPSSAIENLRILVNDVPLAIESTDSVGATEVTSAGSKGDYAMPAAQSQLRASCAHGSTTIQLAGKPGKYRVRIEATNRQPWQDFVQLVADADLQDKIELDSQTFMLHIAIEPAEAEMWIASTNRPVPIDSAGTQVGQPGQDQRLTELPAGEYAIFARASGFAKLERRIVIGEGQQHAYSLLMQQLESYSLWLDSYPQGAAVSLNGQTVGTTPYFWTSLEGHSCELKLVRNGFVTVHTAIETNRRTHNEKAIWYLEHNTDLLAKGGPSN